MIQYHVVTYHTVHHTTYIQSRAKFPSMEMALDYLNNMIKDDDEFGWTIGTLNFYSYRVEKVII